MRTKLFICLGLTVLLVSGLAIRAQSNPVKKMQIARTLDIVFDRKKDEDYYIPKQNNIALGTGKYSSDYVNGSFGGSDNERRFVDKRNPNTHLTKPSSEFDIESLDGPTDYHQIAKSYQEEGNLPDAIKYYEKAALYGHITAIAKLALLHEGGDGIEANHRRAYLYHYLDYHNHVPIEYKSKIEKQKFQDIENRLLPFLSNRDLEWVQEQVVLHKETATKWRHEFLKQEK